MTPNQPPPVLDCGRIIEYAVLSDSVGYSDRTLVFVDGKELGRVSCLAICDDKRLGSVVLFYCDSEWTVLGASGYDSVPNAKERAERTYPGVSACWVKAHVSKEEAERYQDELFGADRCSFCGRRPDQAEQFIHKDEARICVRCIDEFHDTLHESPPEQ